jgi:hypothetical protein
MKLCSNFFYIESWKCISTFNFSINQENKKIQIFHLLELVVVSLVLWHCHIGDHPQKYLTMFGCSPNMKIEIY